jgi:hypothetical protein
MENLDELPAFVYAVIDQDRSMHELTDIGHSFDRAPNVGEL